MTDFARARANMVNAQLVTNGIVNTDLVAAYRALPREALVDELLRARVYMDEDLPLAGGKRWVMEPLVEARLLQEAIKGNCARALVLGASSLPAGVILAAFVKEVIMLEPDAAIAMQAQKRLNAYPVANLTIMEGDYRAGFEAKSPFDIILITGAVAALPQALAAQLSVGGRMLYVLATRENTAGCAIVAHRLHDSSMNTTFIANASTPYLAGFEPAPEFTF